MYTEYDAYKKLCSPSILPDLAEGRLEIFSALEFSARIARHRAERERKEAYASFRILPGLRTDLSPLVRRLGARLVARERFLRDLARGATSPRDRAEATRRLDAYVVARLYGAALVSVVCRGGGAVRVVGEAPAQAGAAFLDGPSGTRLARLAGRARWEDLSTVFRGRNVAEEPCDLGKLPVEVRRALWTAGGFPRRLRAGLTLLLGRTVADLAGLPSSFPPFVWRPAEAFPAGRLPGPEASGLVCYVPHPSGRSRWWDRGAERERGREFLRDFVDEVERRRLPLDGSGGTRYLPRMDERGGLAFVDPSVEPAWAVDLLRVGLPALAVLGEERAA